MRERHLSMRALSVSPRGADGVGSLRLSQGGTPVGETREEGGIKNKIFGTHLFIAVLQIKSIYFPGYLLPNPRVFRVGVLC